MQESVSDANSRLFGYRYQNLIGVLRLIDLLHNKVDKVSFEKKEVKKDHFDDMKVFTNNTIHHYQVKSSYVQNELTLADFRTKKKLHLQDLFDSWFKLTSKFPKKLNYFHIYTTKSISKSNPLSKLIRKINDTRTEFSENKDTVYCLKLNIFQEKEFTEIFKQMKIKANQSTINNFLNSLIIETNQPENPPREFMPDVIIGPLEKIIITKIKKLGLHKAPKLLNPESVFLSLFHLVNRESIISHEITKEELENLLKIKKEFDVIRNTIEFDVKQYVSTTTNLNLLNTQIKKRSGGIIIIQGKPGTGKTWLLTKWINDLKKKFPETPPIWYYSSVSVTEDDDFEIRITKQQLINNLVRTIEKTYHVKNDDYTATSEKLQYQINELGEIGKTRKTVIPIIIDGLDHVFRVKEHAQSISREEETVLDFLNEVSIPDGVCFIFGSQKGTHLEFLKSKYGGDSFFEIPGFSKSETKQYLTKLKVNYNLFKGKRLDTIFEITGGLPLLVNYLGRSLITFKNFDAIKEIPLTEGDVAKYYAYLWQKSDIALPTRVFAKYFSLMEFSASKEFVEKLYPENKRDYEKFETCISPLIPLLKYNIDNEISIFHDSFREYLRNKTDFPIVAQQQYLGDIFQTLLNFGIIENKKSFRYALKYALLSKKFSKILQIVNLEFVDLAMKNIHNRQDIENNLKYAIEAAYENKDTISVLEKSILRKYTIERYRYLENSDFDKLVLLLYPEKISTFLLYENKLNLTLSDTIGFLANALRNKIDLPYDQIIRTWVESHNRSKIGKKAYLPEGISLKDYAVIVVYSKGFKETMEWINSNDFSPYQTFSLMKEILPFTTYEEISSFNPRGTKLAKFWDVLLLYMYDHFNKKKQFQKQFNSNVSKLVNYDISEFPHFLKNSEIIKSKISSHMKKITIIPPTSHEINVSNLLQLEKQIAISTYLEDTDHLEYYKNLILSQSDSFLKRVLHLIFTEVILSMKDLEKISNHDTKLLHDAIIEIMKYDQDRLFDEPGYNQKSFKKYIYRIIENSIRLIFYKSEPKILDSIIKNSKIFGMKYMFTSMSSDNLFELIIKYSVDEKIKEKINKMIDSKIATYETQDMIDICFNACSLYLRLDNRSKAIELFEKAIILSHSYGWRKDYLLFEVLEINDFLNDFEPKKALQRLSTIMKFTEFLDIITDHSGIGEISTSAMKKMLKYNPMATLKTSLQYGVDSFKFPEIVQEFCKIVKKCNPVLRYFLLKTVMPYVNHSQNNIEELFDDKIQCVHDVDAASNVISKKLLLDLHLELLRDFPNITKKIQTKFNTLATTLGITHITATAIEKPESKIEERIPQTFGTSDELYREFEKFHGWGPWSNGRYIQLLNNAYNIDKTKTMELVKDGITNRCLKNDWEPIGLIEEYGRFLQITKQKSDLKRLNCVIDLFCNSLFRERVIQPTHDFEWLKKFDVQVDPTEVGFLFLLKQLDSSDIEIQKRSFVSLIRCLEYEVPNMLHLCVKTLLDSNVNFTLKEKIAGILDAYVTSTKDNSKLIRQSIEYLKNEVHYNLIFVGKHIEEQLGESN